MASIKGKASLIGSVGGIFIGAAILLFIVTIVLQSLRTTNSFGDMRIVSNSRAWNASNATIASLMSFFTIAIILLGVMGITLVGGSIIGYITGMFG